MTEKPARARTGAGAVRSPVVTIVASLAWTIPAFCSAMIPRKRPMPAGMASFRACGTASMIRRPDRQHAQGEEEQAGEEDRPERHLPVVAGPSTTP